MSDPGASLFAARDRLLARLEAPPNAPMVRLRERVEAEVDLLGWLSAQRGRIRGFWADREGGLEVAALGEADEVKGDTPGDYAACLRELEIRWRDADPDTRYYGGFRFGDWHATDSSWRPFQAYRFILPEIELLRRGDGSVELVCNLRRNGPSDPTPRARAALLALAPAAAFTPRAWANARGRLDSPPREAWLRMVERALADIRSGALEKVVLARRVCFELERAVDPFTLIRRVRDEAGRCYLYAGVHDLGFAFIGASPERLYSRTDRALRSEALAGTRPRGADAAADEALGRALLSDSKDRREHQLVVDGIRQALAPLTRRCHVEAEPALLKLANVQHLLTRLEAELVADADDAALLRALHPTPALGGKPPAAARRLIHQLEPFDRGWYSGPIGWIAPRAAEFAVAIRCGLVAGSRFCLYSGAGIVAGSDPAAEWDEMDSKLSGLLRFLGAESTRA